MSITHPAASFTLCFRVFITVGLLLLHRTIQPCPGVPERDAGWIVKISNFENFENFDNSKDFKISDLQNPLKFFIFDQKDGKFQIIFIANDAAG